MSKNIKVTVIGAGSIVFSLGLVKDICLTKSLAGSKVCFMDINAERLDIIHKLAVRYAEDLGADWKGGFFCPCHGSRFDLAARVFKNVPAPTNLVIPKHTYLNDTTILVGEDGGVA